ncbi:hypothetical protein RWH43_06845 [Microbacterium sp. KSW2-21]|uniref:KOW domain-containing protein n=1 Tax=Microbacterium algihabitans TaxID=3075992 RepID=A0ABU3RU97_9MICO|nr:hypothetical protein [Microbacterium sp. KSW2-21]MDU0326476.1 hypothetical protein [Microbacterium sp. KSW2-21]
MDVFAIGDTVEISGPVMAGNIGTVVYLDEKRGKYLVRFGGVTQNYFSPADLRLFSS